MQRFTDVAVVEATQLVSSGEYCLEQTHIVFAGRVEAGIAATLMSFRLCQIGDLLIRWISKRFSARNMNWLIIFVR